MKYKLHINTPDLKIREGNLTNEEIHNLIENTIQNNPKEHMLKKFYDKCFTDKTILCKVHAGIFRLEVQEDKKSET